MLNSLHLIFMSRKRKTACIAILGVIIVCFYIGGILQNQWRLEALKRMKFRPPLIQHAADPRVVVQVLQMPQNGIFPLPQPAVKMQVENAKLLDEENIFIFGAYYDTRDPLGPRIRILTNLDCRFMQKSYFSVKIRHEILEIEWMDFIGGDCDIGSGCKYTEVDLTTRVYTGRFPETVTIVFLNDRQKEIPLRKLPQKHNPGITVCQKPMHWYNDWIRLFLFIEWWKRHSATKILLTAHSISKVTQQLLIYYVTKGLVELRWITVIPNNGKGDPNDEISFGGEHLFDQLCTYISSTEYTALIDLDEFLYIKNGEDLLKFLETQSKRFIDGKVGAFNFDEIPLAFDEDFLSEYDTHNRINFAIMKNPKTQVHSRVETKQKGIFLTDQIRSVNSHGKRRFFASYQTLNISKEEAVCLHARDNFKASNSSAINHSTKIDLFSLKETEEMKKTLVEIFGNKLPKYRFPNTTGVLEKCKKDSQFHQHCQMPTGNICGEKMYKLDEWILGEETPENRWTIL